jgi:hypothetical protein
MSRKRPKLKHYRKARVLALNGPNCEFCGVQTVPCSGDMHALPDNARTFDHIKPLREGGTNEVGNLRILCARCHRRLNADQGEDWKHDGRPLRPSTVNTLWPAPPRFPMPQEVHWGLCDTFERPPRPAVPVEPEQPQHLPNWSRHGPRVPKERRPGPPWRGTREDRGNL